MSLDICGGGDRRGASIGQDVGDADVFAGVTGGIRDGASPLLRLSPGSAVTEERHDEHQLRLRSPPTLVPSVLLLLLAERPSHGYELVERLKDFGFPESGTGRLYRELQRLEGTDSPTPTGSRRSAVVLLAGSMS